MTTFPMGYSNTLVSIQEMRDRHEPKMLPEFARRWFAAVEAAEGLVGIGGGWRSSEQQAANYQRDPNTFAPAGRSFHESQQFAGGWFGYQAIDSVGRDARHLEAWAWLRDNGAAFGLMTAWNWSNPEAWHVQCSDLPRSVSQWKGQGRPDPQTFPIAGVAKPPLVGVDFTRWDEFPTLTPSTQGQPALFPFASFVQRFLNEVTGTGLKVDGWYGQKSAAKMSNFQRWLRDDGQPDPIREFDGTCSVQGGTWPTVVWVSAERGITP